MIFKALSVLVLAALAAAKNPNVVSPQGMTYQAGDMMEVKWNGAETGYVNIDLVDADSKVLPFPMMIASGVPAESGVYRWQIPAELKSAANYKLRVWGSHQPASDNDEGMSSKFTILNNIAGAINTFTVTSPNKGSSCVAGQTCQITWDFPQNGMYPAMVDIALYRVGDPNVVSHIATVSSSLKSFNWAVPNDPSLMTKDVYVSVSGQGAPMAGPGMSNDMGGNSQAFLVAEPGAAAKTGDKKEDGKGKKEAPKKSPPKKAEPRVAGNTSKDKNAASVSSVSSVAGVLSAVLAMTLLNLYL